MSRVGVTLLLAFSMLIVAPFALAQDAPKKASTAIRAEESAKKACANATGATKVECEKVAAEIDANTAEPRRDVERDELSTDDVRHSSTVVAKPDREPARSANKQAPASAPKSDKPAARPANEPRSR